MLNTYIAFANFGGFGSNETSIVRIAVSKDLHLPTIWLNLLKACLQDIKCGKPKILSRL